MSLISGLVTSQNIFGSNMESGLLGNNLIRNKPTTNVFEPLALGEPYLANVVLHLKGDDFTDSSPNPKTLTFKSFANAYPTLNTSIKKYGTSSIYIPRYPYRGWIDVTMPVLGLNPFTIEMWVYAPGNIDAGLYSIGTENSFNSPSVLSLYANKLYTIGYDATNVNYPLNSWFHVALVRENTNANGTKLYLNGVKVHEKTYASNISDVIHHIGIYYSVNYSLGGYIDSLRVTNFARYTANFNPETDTYLSY